MNASFLQRMTAYLMDYGVLIGYGILLLALSRFVPKAWFSTPNRSQLAAFLMLTLPVILYFTFLEAHGGTVGKRLRGLAVVTLAGEPAPLRTTLLRNVIKFLPWEIAHTFVQHQPVWPVGVTIGGSVLAMLLMLGAIGFYFFTSEKQALWDFIAGSRVVTLK